ncbi:S-layer homology domain-containing protein [Patescibacteria group bacterium]|nr:S-layer homology domain-containing protein [Patescibacteria group bacterium]MBU2259121.1 S-layer homology domain-containing protein [Patescibacteria group bacterium]
MFWYAPYVRYAKTYGIVEGYPDGTFKPAQTVNFAEALKIAYSTLNIPTESIAGEWYARYLAHSKYNNILFSNTADVGGNMTRKDVIWIAWKLLNSQ